MKYILIFLITLFSFTNIYSQEKTTVSTIIVNEDPNSNSNAIKILPTSYSVCYGTIVSFKSAVSLDPSTTKSPLYQWYVNKNRIDGATNSTFTYTPKNADEIFCQLIPNGGKGTPVNSNTITIKVTSYTVVNNTITPSSNNIIVGTQVTFNSTVSNGGSSPTYQWKVNNANVGTNSYSYTYTPSNNDKVNCIVTSNLSVECLSNNPATSNTIVMIVNQPQNACGGVSTVTHGGKTYNTVAIGTQCWLKENLNIGTRIDGIKDQTNNNIIEKYCYNNLETNCDIYGGLYQWAELVQYKNGATNSTSWNPIPTSKIQGICPTGWHIPSYSEGAVLYKFISPIDSVYSAGGPMKETGLTHWKSPNGGATNSTGFNAYGSGIRWDNGKFYYLLTDFEFWTSTQASPQTNISAYYRGATYGGKWALNGQFYKKEGLSVRCIKD